MTESTTPAATPEAPAASAAQPAPLIDVSTPILIPISLPHQPPTLALAPGPLAANPYAALEARLQLPRAPPINPFAVPGEPQAQPQPARPPPALPQRQNYAGISKKSGGGGGPYSKKIRKLKREIRKVERETERLRRGPPVLTPAQQMRKEELGPEIQALEDELASLEERKARLAPEMERLLEAIKKAKNRLSQKKEELGSLS
ncbi:hypothetical protein FQN54_005270 [Arachnomyces sp. PD_36]|nr:hypothetical protein FQN54_005270 [Arachnomyces sp. PD_36]